MILILVALWGLAGCAALTAARAPAAPASEGAPGGAEAAGEEAQAPAGEDAVAEIAPTARPVAAGGVLGSTVASLGDPTEGGAWLATGLVTQAGPGRVTDTATGAQARVELRPSGAAPGAGSRLSLAGFQALGLSPAALPRLEVARE
ncbi:MAG: hypothetical protein ACXIUV_12480 [Alkalilacustris sp.]